MKRTGRLAAAWRALCGVTAPPVEEEELLKLQSELAGVRLDLEETRRAIAMERDRTQSLEKGRVAAVEESVDARLDRLFTDLAAPLSQLRTQAHLLDTGTPVAATDVVAVAQQFARAVEEAGLTPFGEPGESAAFDPETMQPLRSDQPLTAGEAATVRFAGYRYAGRVLRKALVERTA